LADRQDDCLPLTHVVEELRKLLKLHGTLAAQPAVPQKDPKAHLTPPHPSNLDGLNTS